MERQKIKICYKATILITLIIICGFGLNSCYFDHEDELYPSESCDNENVSYLEDILPIMENACYDCHDFANAPVLGDGINIEGYERLKQYIESNENKFIGSIERNGQASAMPKNGPKLDVCAIDKIDVWINEGILNN